MLAVSRSVHTDGVPSDAASFTRQAKEVARKIMTTNCFIPRYVRITNAVDHLTKAGREVRTWNEHWHSGDLLRSAADLLTAHNAQFDDNHAVALLCEEAGRQFWLAQDAEAGNSIMIRSEECLVLDGKMVEAARLAVGLGEAAEREQGTTAWLQARAHFERAEMYYSGGGRGFELQSCREKQAMLSASRELGDFARAAQIFERIGYELVSDRIGKFTAHKFFARAVLCHLAGGDGVGARMSNSKFARDDYRYTGSADGRLAATLVEATELHSAQAFRAAYKEAACTKIGGEVGLWYTAVLSIALRYLMCFDGSTNTAKGIAMEGGAKNAQHRAEGGANGAEHSAQQSAQGGVEQRAHSASYNAHGANRASIDADIDEDDV